MRKSQSLTIFDISKTTNGAQVTMLNDGPHCVTERSGGSATHTLHGPFIDQPLARAGLYYSVDGLGSTDKLTDGAGNVVRGYSYGPFGEPTPSSGTGNPFQFTGRENDETGLMYYRARYYAPQWGRFVSEDPIGFAGGINPYVYVDNNPLSFVDPWGLLTLPQDPSGLGPDWDRIPHGKPGDPDPDNKQRWVHKNGVDGLEWHRGDPDAPKTTWRSKDHWHRLKPANRPGKWDTEDDHFLPGQEVPDPVSTSRWEPALEEVWDPYIVFPVFKLIKVPAWIKQLPAAGKAIQELFRNWVPTF